MEKQYRLKAIRISRSTDFFSVVASIYLGERRIGTIRTCSDTEEIEFEFALAMDRLVFENFITDWWDRADRRVHYGATELLMVQTHADFHPSLPVKMRCWVKAIVMPAPANAQVQGHELAAA